jgi:hypothetical protein
MDLVSLIKSQISSGVSEKFADLLGTDSDTARTATNAAIPSLLAGLSSVASTPEGARRLDAALEDADENAFADPARAVSQARSGDSSGGLLGSLLGGGMMSGLGGVLGRFSGISAGKIMGLLGMLGPIILGFLKGQKRTMGLDAGGLASLLASQKQNIANAIPSGLSKLMPDVPGLSSLTGAAGAAWDKGRETVSGAAARGREYAGDVAYGARSAVAAGRETTSSAARWALPLAAILLLGALAWWLSTRNRGPDRTAVAPPQTPAAVNRAVSTGAEAAGNAQQAGARIAEDASAAGTDVANKVAGIGKSFSEWTTSTTETLGSITDEASATAALPKLQDMARKLGSVSTLASSLPESGRQQVVAMVEKSRPALDKAFDRVLAIPGVSNTIKPVITEIRTQLDKIAPPASVGANPAPY